MKSFTDTLLEEYRRLCRQDARLTCYQSLAQRRLPQLRERQASLRDSLRLYGVDIGRDLLAFATDHYAHHYTHGLPLSLIADTLRAKLGLTLPDPEIDALAAKDSIARPVGWSAAKADRDLEDEDFEIEDVFGIPDPADPAIETAPEPAPTKTTPEPAPAKTTPEPAPAKTAPARAATTSSPAARAKPVAKASIDRSRYLRHHYAAGTSDEAILAGVNTLPGEPLTKDELAAYAARLNVKRPAWFTSPRDKVDQLLSVAARQDRDLAACVGEAPVTLAVVLEWGRRNGIVIADGVDWMDALRAINDRRDEHRLPRFRIVPPRGIDSEHLPGEHVR